MRRPSTDDELLNWHNHAMSGNFLPHWDGEPQCGWYRMRMVKGGPYVPVLIWCDRDIDEETGELASPEIFRANVNGESRDPKQIWTYCTPISRDDYERLVERHQTDARMAATHKPIDLLEMFN